MIESFQIFGVFSVELEHIVSIPGITRGGTNRSVYACQSSENMGKKREIIKCSGMNKRRELGWEN